ARRKREGSAQAPVQLAGCADETTPAGHGLGRQTMPETLRYSVVAAIQTLWLAARAEGLGVGWVSILDPAAVHRMLDLPPHWTFIAYLCIGWPEEEHDDPELERHGWEARLGGEALTPVRREQRPRHPDETAHPASSASDRKSPDWIQSRLEVPHVRTNRNNPRFSLIRARRRRRQRRAVDCLRAFAPLARDRLCLEA